MKRSGSFQAYAAGTRAATLVALFAALACRPALPPAAGGAVHASPNGSLDIRVVTDQVDAVLAILAKRSRGEAPSDGDWDRLSQSEGFRRLGHRAAQFGQRLDESIFRSFVMSDRLLARYDSLRDGLAAWRATDLMPAARRAFAYLPEGTAIRSKVYPVIKQSTNSFVFEPTTDPAIFLYLDPSLHPAKFANIVAHELHHIGTAAACATAPSDSGAPPSQRLAVTWLSAFAEGRAMLAAAGGPGAHPHADSDHAERATWDRDVARVKDDLPRVEGFILALLDGTLPPDSASARGFAFVSTDSVPQGAFYTLGWVMASTIERHLGRERLVASTCDPVRFVLDYERAVDGLPSSQQVVLPRWSPLLLRRLSALP